MELVSMTAQYATLGLCVASPILLIIYLKGTSRI